MHAHSNADVDAIDALQERHIVMSHVTTIARKFARCAGLLASLWGASIVLAHSQETICAKVKIEIKQELTLERQAFDAEMKINNALDGASLTEVDIDVVVMDETGTPVAVSFDPNSTSAKFFIRVASRDKIDDIDGNGSVAPKSTATVNWLLIPAPGAAGVSEAGRKYLVGATLRYKFGAETHTLDVSPDVITVKPLPQLTLDYFLTKDVVADDPLTPAIEPIEPFTLGVRVQNNGAASAKNLKIDSAQPKIIENNQGLLINFRLTGSYVDDAPVQNTLLINFGEIASQKSKMGRWVMETTLAGTFTEFTAKYSHSDELGGALTSLLQATNAHFLIRDIRVDLPGRDMIRDFLALDGEAVRVFESDGLDAPAIDRSAQAQLDTSGGGFRITMPATQGFVYAKMRDPYNGARVLGRVTRSDAKQMLPENVWLSKARNRDTNSWEYWLNVFDANSTGVYSTEFNDPSTAPRPPVVQFVPDRTVREGQQVSFLVEASSPDGRDVTLAAAPLPTGASFAQQPPNPAFPGVTVGVFDWTPTVGQAGNYLIVYTARDGNMVATRSASIRVESSEPPPGPGVPTIEAPGLDVQVPFSRPTLIVRTSSNALDPATSVQFEVYSDEAMTQLVESGQVNKGVTTGAAGTTSFQLANSLNDNSRYWWRARAYDGTSIYSAWVNGRFRVNLFNDAPESFNLTNPAPGAEVSTLLPDLSWTNSSDRDGDALSYTVQVSTDITHTQVVASATGLSGDPSGTTTWQVNNALTNHTTYYWRVVAIDALGAETPTIARTFTVNTGNAAPTDPVVTNPADGGNAIAQPVALTVQNSLDADGDLLTYVFEYDTVSTFDSGNRHTSPQIIQGAGGTTSWEVSGLTENTRYYWRAKAQDGRTESAWVTASFRMNSANDAPPAPTVRNPGNGAWSTTTQPTLEANPVEDPEEGAVRYEFELYQGATSGNIVVSGASPETSFVVPTALADDSAYRWRARAVDMQDAASAWSDFAVLYVSTGPYEDPSIQLMTPASPIKPDVNGTVRTVTINWQGTDNNIEATVALYFSQQRAEFAGDLIVDGLRQPAGTHSGTYIWDVSSLAPGAYYVYGMIYDARGIGRAFAPGAVIIPNPNQTGAVTITPPTVPVTSESGTSVTFKAKLAVAPTTTVTLPVRSSRPTEGLPSTSLLTFTPSNWNTNQTVTVTGQRDCAPDGLQNYQVLVGAAATLDPNYIGINAPPVNLQNLGVDISNTTNVPTLHICRIQVVSSRRVGLLMWEYVLNAELTNSGAAPITSLTANLTTVPGQVQVIEGILQFGMASPSETVRSSDTFTIRSRLPVEELIPVLGLGFRWTVTYTQ